MNEELKENALNDNDLEQVTGGKTNMKKNKDYKGKKMTATVGHHVTAAANGKQTIAEEEFTAFANEN